MSTFHIFILALAYSGLVESLEEAWQPLDVNDPWSQLGNIPIAGFQRAKYEDGGGNVALYLCLAVHTQGNRISAGKLFTKPDGEMVCYATHYSDEFALVNNNENYGNILVLTTPPECYTWERYDPYHRGWPPNYIHGATTRFGYGSPTPICRVYDPDFEVHIPGYMDGNICMYPYHGVKQAYENGHAKLDVLVWSDYALSNPDQCTDNGPTPIPELLRRK